MSRRRSPLRLPVLALLVLGAGLAWWQRAAIGTAVYERMVAARAGRDSLAGRPDGLAVVLCGTGSPLPDATRAGPCALVVAERHVFIVDAGEGGARKLAGWGVPLGRVEAAFLTHLHSDHFDGLGPLMLMRWTGGARAPLPLVGPAGVEQMVAGLNTAYAIDAGYRTAHHGPAIAPPQAAGLAARPFAVPGAVWRGDGVTVTAFTVDHRPAAPAVGYRFDYKGRSLVISGDTRAAPAVAAAARGADLLVHEALQPRLLAALTRGFAARGQTATAQITRDILNYHATPEQAADTARAAVVHALLLTHIVPPLPSPLLDAAFLGDAPSRFAGSITVGREGMIVSLPAGSRDIVMGSLE